MTRRTIARALVQLSLIAATVVVLLPLVVVLLTSLKSEKEMANTSGASAVSRSSGTRPLTTAMPAARK